MKQIRRDFNLIVFLMVLFFFVELGTDALFVMGYTLKKIGNGLAHDAYIQLSGIAFGIFRGMKPHDDEPGGKP